MKIAVLVKQVPGSESSLPINSDQNWIDEEFDIQLDGDKLAECRSISDILKLLEDSS